jgi:hypothetical protein
MKSLGRICIIASFYLSILALRSAGQEGAAVSQRDDGVPSSIGSAGEIAKSSPWVNERDEESMIEHESDNVAGSAQIRQRPAQAQIAFVMAVMATTTIWAWYAERERARWAIRNE